MKEGQIIALNGEAGYQAELLRGVWGHPADAATRTLDSHASRLRHKLAAADPIKVEGGQKLAAACTATTVSRDTIGWGQVDTDLVTCNYDVPAS